MKNHILTPPKTLWRGTKATAAVAAVIIAGSSAFAATNTYQGGATGTWNSNASWSLGTIAGASDDATFAGSTALTGVTLGANQSALSLAITNTAATTIANTGGFTLTLGAGGISKALGSGALTVNPTVAIGADQSWTNNATATGITIGGALTGSSSLALTTTANDNATIQFNGSGAGYTGSMSITGGRLTWNNATATGVGMAVTVNSGAQLFANTNTTYNVVVSGTGYGAGANSTAFRTSLNTVHSGSVTVAGSANVSSFNRTSTISGQITSTGAGDLTLGTSGTAGTMILSNTANNWAGATTVVSSYTIQANASEILPDTTALTLTGTGTFNHNGATTETVASLSGAGFVQNQVASTAATFVVNGGGGATFSGVIRNNSGTGGTVAFTKTGSGTQILSGANTYTGATTINGGTLQLGASDRLSNSSNMVLGGGTFATAGFSETVGTLTINSSSFLDFGSGTSALVFGDSSALTWTGTLTLQNFDIGTDTLKFGTSASALTGSQLSAILLSGYSTGLDSSGFVTFTAVPEPHETALAMIGLMGIMIAFRRRHIANG